MYNALEQIENICCEASMNSPLQNPDQLIRRIFDIAHGALKEADKLSSISITK